jgi:membrane complex biogenesis BtpA family protein
VQALVAGGAHGILFENYGDAPFIKGKVGVLTVSNMTRIILHCTEKINIPFGVNVLRNDWEAALTIAATTGAAFIRINVLSGVFATDQGIIEGEAYAVLRYRRALGHELGRKILIFADVHTKHGTSLLNQTISNTTKDLVERVGVDGLIVTGARTGEPPAIEDVETVAKASSSVPVLVGSGVNPENIKTYLPFAQGFIVGTYLKKDRKIENQIESARVKELVGILS